MNALIALLAYLFYWLTKLIEAKRKNKKTFYVNIFITDNLLTFVTTFLGSLIAYYVIPVYMNIEPNYLTAFLSGYCGSSILRFITKAIEWK